MNVADGDQTRWDFTAKLRTAYLVEFGPHYLKPHIDLNVSQVGFDRVKETGGPEALTVHGMTESTVSISPALELGTIINMSDNLTVRPYLTIGATAFTDGDLGVRASMNGAPDVPPFTIIKEVDHVVAEIGAGAELLSSENALRVRLDYAGRFSENLSQHSFAMRGSVPF